MRLVGAAEPDAARRGWFERAAPGLPAAPTLGALLERARPEAVIVATPPATHAALAAEALAAGCHVLVEKPMATACAEAAALAARAAASGRRLAVGLNRRFRAPYRLSRDRIRAATGSGDGATASFEARLVSDAGRWAHGGGADRAAMLEDLAPHLLDLVPWLAGRRVAAVRADDDAAPAGLAPGLRFALALAGDGGSVVEAPCVVGYGGRHEEAVAVAVGGSRWVAHAWGVVPGARGTGGGGPLRRAQSLLGLAVPKALGRPTLTGRSLTCQLEAFARWCRGGDPGELAGPGAGVRAAAALDALLESAARGGGAWVAVRGGDRGDDGGQDGGEVGDGG